MKTPRFNYSFRYKEGEDRVTFTSATQENLEQDLHQAFYNPKTASLKRELDKMEGNIKSWHQEFKKKHGRKPNLEDMRQDPSIGLYVTKLSSQKQMMRDSVQRWRLN